ncbi:MAG: M23 family metallopeptidase [Clostridia bacterium]|nr:M23 family metallopeptidase [Clostridia bacterium]
MNHRHRSRTALIVFLLCLPLALIAYFTYSFLNEKLDPDDIVKIDISSEGSEKVTVSEREDIVFYTDLFESSVKLDKPLREIDESTAVRFDIDRGDSVLHYYIYPELSETGCMFKDQKGNYYQIQKEDARAMLSRAEFAYLYVASALPELKVISGSTETEIQPLSYSWEYKQQNGEYVEYNEKPVSDGSEKSRIYSNRTNSMVFSRKPDDLVVTITDPNGNVLPQTDIGDLVLGNDTLLTVTVNATWLKTGMGNCDGSATYEFELLYDIPAMLAVSTNETTPGGCVILNLRFLNDDEQVILRCESKDIELGELYFSENEGVMTAALGIGYNDKLVPGKYTVYYTIGENNGSFDLNLSAPTGKSSTYRLSMTGELYETALGEAAQAELQDIIDVIYSAVSEKAYVLPPFAKPVTSDKLAQAYGTDVIVTIDDSPNSHPFNAIGNTYSVSVGDKVYAAAKGKVAYVGYCGTLGDVIIIDHGCGVFSWYYGLDNIERGVGTEVGPSTALGTAGRNQYDNTASVGFCVTAGKVFINPTPPQKQQ